MAIGDSKNILLRVLGVLPRRWFKWGASYRDALAGGLSDLGAWCYNWIGYARLQTRLATATGVWLDIFCYDFLARNLLRNGAIDSSFRTLIQATILKERVTRKGMFRAIKTLTGNNPVIFEPWNTGDTGAWSDNNSYQNMAWDTTGGWGEMSLQGQVLITVTRGVGSGIANVNGLDGYQGGWDQGSIEFVSDSGGAGSIGVTNAQIYQLIVYTKPTGVTVWTNIQ